MNGESSGRSASETRRPMVPFLLSVRTQRTWWQMLKAWLWQGWQRLRLPRVQVQPPLQPARHKPFPQRPHQQRRQAVFAALDAAPASLTRRQLIAHVRAVTGLGCSEKLITEWRKERQRDSATEGGGDAGKRRRGVLGLLLCLGINACATMTTPLAPPAPPSEITISPAPTQENNFSNLPPPLSPSPNPRLLRIKLTLNAPHELQVKAGQQVEAGALLSDRQTARQRLLVQKRALVVAAQSLQRQRQLSAASLRYLQSLGLALPPTTFAAEEAAIKRAKAEAVAVQRQVEMQRQKWSVVSGPWSVALFPIPTVLPENELAREGQQRTTDDGRRTLIQQHEEAKFAQAQDKQLLALAEIGLHKAKLTTAREARVVAEKQHRVEVTRQILSAQSQQQQAAIEAARLTAQLAELELQLALLAEVRASFAGTIKRIEWEEMNDEKLTVVVYLAVQH